MPLSVVRLPQYERDFRDANRINLLINGDMRIAQRTVVEQSAPTASTITVDRWELIKTSDASWKIGRESAWSAAGTPFNHCLKCTVTSGAAATISTRHVIIQQRIETNFLSPARIGTVNATPLTLSFWVFSSIPGTYIAELRLLNVGHQISRAYEITQANVWEYKTIIFPPNTLATLDYSNGTKYELYVMFWLAAGPSFTSDPLQTEWAGYLNASRATGQTDLGAVTDAYIAFTGVQLEPLPEPTPFIHTDYSTELRKCQRYFEHSFPGEAVPVNNRGDDAHRIMLVSGTASNAWSGGQVYFRETKRESPDITTWALNHAEGKVSKNGTTHQNANIQRVSPAGFAVFTQSLNTTFNLYLNWAAEAE